MQIRRAVVADAAQIASVHVQSWQEGYRGQLPQSLLDALDPADRVPRWQEAAEQAQWPTRGTLLAHDADRLLGFANLCPTRDVDQDPASIGEITSFYVLPVAWGQGVGRQLMAASVQTLADAGYQTGTLWVLDTNIRAIAFYEALGWTSDGAIKHDVLAGVHLIDHRYRRSLRNSPDRSSRLGVVGEP